MKDKVLILAIAAALAAPTALHAQAMTGESHPELLKDDVATTTPDPAPVAAKPSPLTLQAADPHAPVMPATGVPQDAAMPGPAPVAVSAPAPLPPPAAEPMPSADYGVVTRVAHAENQLAEGTLIKTHLEQSLSSAYTQVGTPFSARLLLDVVQDGRVIIPVGSVLEGRVVKVSENRRIQGHARMRLRPDEVILPDGTRLMLHAQLIDTDRFAQSRIDSEGTLVSRDNAAKYWEIAGSTTGSGAVGGALIGGGIGAGVGAVIGAGVGATHYMMDHPVAALPKSSTLVFQLTEPMPILPLHE